MPKLSLSVLGPFAAYLDERPLTQFRTKSVQALLVYLACQPEVHQREQLMALLWPGLPQKSAQGNLRQTLYLLHKAIPELPAKNGNGAVPLLLADRQTVQMNPDGRFDLDYRTFTEKLKGDESGWAETAALYRGDFLADFYLPDSAPFEEWTLARRADLRRRMLETLETLTDYAMQIGDLAGAESHARRQLEIDNLRESAHRQLMEVLARNGRRRAAISQYEVLTQLLQDELAIEPTASTQALHEAIRSGEFDGTAAPALPAPMATAPKPPKNNHNLPIQTTLFFGRESEISALNEFMTHQGVRLITIVGPGGMGKTRLALETARQQLDNFDHGIWFASLAKLSSPDEIVPATAQTLHFNFYEGGTPRQQLLDYLRNKSLLLVMDNYEHLLDGADLVADVLQTAPQVKVLVTSREPLRLVEEQLFPLSGLAFSHEDVVEGDAAVQLFLERARHLRPDLALKADDMAYVTTICRQVDGMPLGLELAAAWVDTLSLAEIATELQESLDLLESDMRNVADRHRSLRAVFETSWDRLQPDEQQLFAQLSIFRGGFTQAAAKEICAPDLSQPAFHRLLATLTRKSFLKHDMENGRYDIHELMRQFGAEKLAQSPDQYEAVKDRHSSYYCAFLKEQEARIKGPQQKEAVAEIEIEYENARTAWEWAVERERVDWLDQALDGLCRYYEWQGLVQEFEPTCQLASEKLMPSASGDGLRVLARILTWQGFFLPDETDRQLLEQSLSMLKRPDLDEHDTRAEQAFALLRMGGLTVGKEPALEFLHQSLALYRELGDQWNEARVLHGLAGMGSKANGFDQVEQWGMKSLEIRQKLGDDLGVADLLTLLAMYAREQGQTEKAESLIKQSLNLLQRLGNQPQLANALVTMAIIKGNSGQFAEDQFLLKESLEITNELGMRYSSALSYEHLGWAAIHLGKYTRAREYLEISRPIYQELNSKFGQGLILADLCMIELAGEKYNEANKLSQKGLMVFQEIEVTYMIGFVLSYLAYAERGQNNPDASRQCIIKALNVTIKSSILEALLEVLPPAALLFADQGKTERAIEIYSLATCRPYVANSQWFEDVAGQTIKSIAASLPPEVVAAAEERGRALDFWETAVSLLAELSAQD